MKIRSVNFNNRRKAFCVHIGATEYWLPYARLDEQPMNGDRVTRVSMAPELGREGFTYTLSDGREGTVLSDQVLDFNDDPRYVREMVLYGLTLEAETRLERSGLSKREVMRRLKTSPTQFYRLLDPTNVRKSVDQMLRLLSALNCYVEFTVKDARAT